MTDFHNLLIRFCLFGLIGIAAFFVDVLVYVLLHAILETGLVRFISFFTAVLATWTLNRNITFKGKRRFQGLLPEFVAYFSASLIGGGVNLTLFFVLISLFDLARDYPTLAIAIGSLAGMLANFFLSRFVLLDRKIISAELSDAARRKE